MRKRKILIVFDDMIADKSKKKCQAINKELFIWRRKVNISLVFITQSYFSVPKDATTEKNYKLLQLIILQILIITIL